MPLKQRSIIFVTVKSENPTLSSCKTPVDENFAYILPCPSLVSVGWGEYDWSWRADWSVHSITFWNIAYSWRRVYFEQLRALKNNFSGESLKQSGLIFRTPLVSLS